MISMTRAESFLHHIFSKKKYDHVMCDTVMWDGMFGNIRQETPVMKAPGVVA